MLRVLADTLLAADRGDVSAVVLLDMTAAFDTVNHSILFQLLQSTFGIYDTAHRWFQSYLSGREQHLYADDVHVYGSRSPVAVDALSMKMSDCAGDHCELWARSSRLMLNPDKSEAV